MLQLPPQGLSHLKTGVIFDTKEGEQDFLYFSPMKKFSILLVFLFVSSVAISQEIPSSSKKPVFERPISSGNPLIIPSAPKEDFKLKDDPRKPKPIEMVTKQDLLTAGDFLQKKWSEDAQAHSDYGKGQDLGSFVTKGPVVELYCRDAQHVDGDRVRVYLNGKIIQTDIYLQANYTPVLIRLENGFNTIEIEALNQGSSGPNTAAFSVFDESGKMVTSSEWNLLTGARATMIVVKN